MLQHLLPRARLGWLSAPLPVPVDSKIFARRPDPLFPDVHLGHEPTSSNVGQN